ncbi:endonuclease/exonuclease/phosphatase family protein, partial [Actinophytocola sp.]|uniref:endonuclease/exonuclease/phosphatase family protein n=1 Tax=Actinophytocola sp. TaxID=1872138 RepID=UPI002D7E4DA6
TDTVRVLQLNICHGGWADCFTGERVTAKAASVIAASRAQVVSVNEACSNDVEPLRSAMGPARTMFAAAQLPTGEPVLCLNGREYGNFIMVAESLAGGPGVHGRFTAQDRSDEMRSWACLPGAVLSACTTHLSAYDSTAALAQCRDLLTRAAGYAVTGPTVVVGDINLRYRGRPNVQDCAPAGFYRKGDGSVQHVFASNDLGFIAGTAIDMSGTTDHPAWLVTLTR